MFPQELHPPSSLKVHVHDVGMVIYDPQSKNVSEPSHYRFSFQLHVVTAVRSGSGWGEAVKLSV